ncbi:MAG TPA: O-antigen ligase family protein [Terrimicrobiaceae bacterium]|nr:O-antigen ligase family protein [Terrimicrobiaceae bacterium]
MIAALFIGRSIAFESYFPVILLALFAIGVIYLSGGSKYTFHMLLFAMFLDASFKPGFNIASGEQFALICGMVILITCWRPAPEVQKPQVLAHWSLSLVKTFLSIWLGYVILHAVFHFLYFPSEGLKNIIKSYGSTFFPYLFALYFLNRPSAMVIPRNYSRMLFVIMLAALCIALMMRVYQTHFGAMLESFDPGDVGMAGPLMIGPIFFVENVYALRGIAPGGVLAGVALLVSRYKGFQNDIMRLVALSLILIGITGCLYSGGRASIVIAAGYTFIVLVLRRKISWLFVGVVATVIAIAFANLFSDWVNRSAPMQLARTLQWVLIEKDDSSSKGIEDSGRWRSELRRKAFEEWKSTPKNLWFGQGFQGISSSDYAQAGYSAGGNFTGVSEDFGHYISIKRVATHNMFTDVLVGYGLVGAIFYYSLLLALMSLIYHIYFWLPPDSEHKEVALLSAAAIWGNSILGNWAGTFLYAIVFTYLVILISALYQHPPKVMANALPAPER